jgi:cell wall-associated NlpC family hydrolase
MSRAKLFCAIYAAIILVQGCLGCAPKRVVTTRSVDEPAVAEATIPTSEPASKTPATQLENNPETNVRADSTGDQAVELARAQIGKPYQWGAAGPEKFDCSGLVQFVYKNLGVPLPRVSGAQASSGVHVDRKDLKPGDLVFFRLTGGPINHVGIYVGRGKFIHAPKKNNPVRFDSLNDSWWGQKFKGGRRVG